MHTAECCFIYCLIKHLIKVLDNHRYNGLDTDLAMYWFPFRDKASAVCTRLADPNIFFCRETRQWPLIVLHLLSLSPSHVFLRANILFKKSCCCYLSLRNKTINIINLFTFNALSFIFTVCLPGHLFVSSSFFLFASFLICLYCPSMESLSLLRF